MAKADKVRSGAGGKANEKSEEKEKRERIPRGEIQSKNKGTVLAQLNNAFEILNRLQSGRDVSYESLAHEFSLSPRQIQRYIITLEKFGVGIERKNRGENQSFIHVTEFRRNLPSPFNALILSREDLLLLYAHLAGVYHAGDQERRDLIWSKVRKHLGMDSVNGEVVKTVLGTFDKAYKSYEHPEKKKTIAGLLDALYNNRPCDLSYRTPNGEERPYRSLHPYELVEHDGGLYCYFFLPWAKKGANRVLMLAVERIATLNASQNQEFRREESVRDEIQKKKSRSFRITDQGKPFKFTLRFTPAAKPYALARIWHPSQSKPQDSKDGSVRLSFKATGRNEIITWILGWGSACKVISPPDLKSDVMARLGEALSQYGE